MSDIVPTIVIKGQEGQPLVINASDFDESKHVIFGSVEKPSFDRKGAMAFLDSKEIKYAKNISDDKLKELVKTTLSIVEKDGNIIIIDGEGNQVGAESFATMEDAETMLKMFTGK